MAKKSSKRKLVSKALKKEVELPIKLPDNRVGKTLVKKRNIIFGRYFRESWGEIKKVTWPNRKETLKLTFAVILFTAVFTIFMSLTDVGVSNVVERILL